MLVVPHGIESLDSFGLIQPDGIICYMNRLAVVIIIVVTLVVVVLSRVLR